MRKVTVLKSELAEKLRENRANHRQAFEEAVEGYRKKVTEELERHIGRVKNGSPYRVYVVFPQPEDHTADYDRALKMLEMHQGDTVEIAQQEFAQIVMDDWDWKDAFLTTNASYTS